jgi:hypothetical protein
MFPIDYFKIVADALPGIKFNNKNHIITAIHRTAIGRYYYYIFLKYRERLSNVLKSDDKSLLYKFKLNPHILIPLTLKHYDKHGIAEKYHELRKLRNECDYNLFAIIDQNRINYAKLIVFFLEKGLDSIKPCDGLNESFAKAVKELSSKEDSNR